MVEQMKDGKSLKQAITLSCTYTLSVIICDMFYLLAFECHLGQLMIKYALLLHCGDSGIKTLVRLKKASYPDLSLSLIN